MRCCFCIRKRFKPVTVEASVDWKTNLASYMSTEKKVLSLAVPWYLTRITDLLRLMLIMNGGKFLKSSSSRCCQQPTKPLSVKTPAPENCCVVQSWEFGCVWPHFRPHYCERNPVKWRCRLLVLPKLQGFRLGYICLAVANPTYSHERCRAAMSEQHSLDRVWETGDVECGHGSLDNYCEATTPVEDIWEVLSTAIYMYMVEQGYWVHLLGSRRRTDESDLWTCTRVRSLLKAKNWITVLDTMIMSFLIPIVPPADRHGRCCSGLLVNIR